MKKKVFISLLFISFLLLNSFAFAGNAHYGFFNGYEIVKMIVNGKDLVANSVPAILFEGKTMLPVRDVANSLLAATKWNEDTGSVELIKPNVHMLLTLNSLQATKNGTSFTNIAAPFGRVKLGEKVSFNVYGEVDKYNYSTITFRLDLISPGGKVFYGTERSADFDYTNNSFVFTDSFNNFYFDEYGNYLLQFKIKVNDKFYPVGEKTIVVR